MDMRLRDSLLSVAVEEPVTAGKLQVFGLRWSRPGDLPYVTMNEAMKAGVLEITEVSEGGHVPELKTINKGDSMVLLLAGDMLIGAKQNRVLNTSMMVPAKSETLVPVSCVERGRWDYNSRSFSTAGSSSHGKLRCMLVREVAISYRTRGRPGANQGAVWDEVDRKLARMGSRSRSAALQQAYTDRASKLDEIVAKLRLPEGCCGVAFALDGRVTGVELFDKPQTLANVLPKLVRSYAIDCLEHKQGTHEAGPASDESSTSNSPAQDGKKQGVDRAVVAEWLHSAAEMKAEAFASPGAGQDIRLEGADKVGACLMVEDRPVHTAIFSDSKKDRPPVDRASAERLLRRYEQLLREPPHRKSRLRAELFSELRAIVEAASDDADSEAFIGDAETNMDKDSRDREE